MGEGRWSCCYGSFHAWLPSKSRAGKEVGRLILILKLFDFAVVWLPVILELFNKKRSPEEGAKEYVKRIQEEKLKTYRALQEDTGEEFSRLSWNRIHMAMLSRVRDVHEPPPIGPDVPSEGA